MARIIADGALLPATLVRVLSAVGGALDCTLAFLWSAEAPAASLRCIGEWAREDAPPSRLSALSRVTVLAEGQGLAGRALLRGEAVFMKDPSTHGSSPRHVAAAHDGLRSGVAFPIRVMKDAVGAIGFFSTDEEGLGDDAVLVLESVAPAIAQLVDRMRWRGTRAPAWHREQERIAGALAALEHASSTVLAAARVADVEEVARIDAEIGFGAAGVALFVPSESGDTLERVFNPAPVVPASVRAGSGEAVRLDEPGPLADAVHSGKPIFLESGEAVIPVFANGALVLVVRWDFPRSSVLSPQDRSVLVSLAHTAALALRAVRLGEAASAKQSAKNPGQLQEHVSLDPFARTAHAASGHHGLDRCFAAGPTTRG